MSASAQLEMPSPQPGGSSVHQARLAALRQTVEGLDPARLHYLDVLSQRITAAPVAVQRALESKLDIALTDLEARLQQPRAAASAAGTQRSIALLAQLNQYIRGLKQSDGGRHPGLGLDRRLDLGLASDGDTRPELASVRRFREAWSRIAAEDQVIKAVERGPANAGPLNSHMLVLRTLALLRKLSPDYLRRFLSHVESLQWLEQASQTMAPVKTKPPRRNRAKK